MSWFMSLFRPLARSPRVGRAFGAATSGSVMPAFALMMTAAAMVTGGAVDYAQMQNVREKLNAAADAAALSATSKQALTSSAATAQTQAAAIFKIGRAHV